jgi:hypothetical protein
MRSLASSALVQHIESSHCETLSKSSVAHNWVQVSPSQQSVRVVATGTTEEWDYRRRVLPAKEVLPTRDSDSD